MDDSQLAALARAATPGPWTAGDRIVDADGNAIAMVNLAMRGDLAEALAGHIAAWSPERALAALECVATLRDGARDEQSAALAAWDALAKGSEG